MTDLPVGQISTRRSRFHGKANMLSSARSRPSLLESRFGMRTHHLLACRPQSFDVEEIGNGKASREGDHARTGRDREHATDRGRLNPAHAHGELIGCR